MCSTFRKRFYPLFDFKQRHNTTVGKTEQILDAIIHAAITNDFIENGTNILRMEERSNIPAPRTIRYHLGKLNIEEIKMQFDNIFEEIYRETKKQRAFIKPIDVAVDIMEWMYYGDKNDQMVVGTKHKNGTSKCFRFATINIVENGERFTLYAIPMNQFTPKHKVLKELLEYAMEKIKIRRIYVDRGFFDTKCIRVIEDLGLNFLMPAVKNKRIARLAESNDSPTILDYKMGVIRGHKDNPKFKNPINFKLVIVEDENEEKRVFATNLNVREENAKDLFNLYDKRWGIETSYRVKGDFRPRTTSKNYAIRLFLFLFSVCLYNLWVLASVFIGMAMEIKVEKPLITTKMFGTMIITVCGSGG